MYNKTVIIIQNNGQLFRKVEHLIAIWKFLHNYWSKRLRGADLALMRLHVRKFPAAEMSARQNWNPSYAKIDACLTETMDVETLTLRIESHWIEVSEHLWYVSNAILLASNWPRRKYPHSESSSKNRIS